MDEDVDGKSAAQAVKNSPEQRQMVQETSQTLQLLVVSGMRQNESNSLQGTSLLFQNSLHNPPSIAVLHLLPFPFCLA